jgi:hypothetical protein
MQAFLFAAQNASDFPAPPIQPEHASSGPKQRQKQKKQIIRITVDISKILFPKTSLPF